MTNYFVHKNGLVETGAEIGTNTRIWAFAHILGGAKIGSDCNICDNVFIENDVVIGDRVTIKPGVQLWDGVRIDDDVFIGPNATFTNDPFPRSKQYLSNYPITRICVGASIGANATILPGIVVGRNAMVGAGCVVTQDVPPNAIVYGNPARIHSYSTTDSKSFNISSYKENDLPQITINGVKAINIPSFIDMRGSLVAGEVAKHIPFEPARFFLVYDVPSQRVRGEHAHKECFQFLICVHGSCAVVVDNGFQRQEIRLDSPMMGLLIPPMIWATQYNYSTNAVLLVLASHVYNSGDYIRNYDDYLQLIK